MYTNSYQEWKHDHSFAIDDRSKEKRTTWVLILTVGMMVVEIAAGYSFGSMALLADGWHMGTHATALGIAVFAYVFARKNSGNPLFSFGTGKVGSLGGFGSAMLLGVVAITMCIESIERLISPVSIRFTEAIFVAVLGLSINVISAFLLRERHTHSHDHHHAGEHHHHDDHNFKAAYLHVIADALTSVLAIVALITGKLFGWVLLDPVIGIVGAVLIIRWGFILAKDAGTVLLDYNVDQNIVQENRHEIETTDDSHITDIHVWKIGYGKFSMILSVVSHQQKSPQYYKELLAKFPQIGHLTVEVNHPNQHACNTL